MSLPEDTYRRIVETTGGQRLEATVSLLQAALDSTADGLLMVDCDGRIVGFNHRFVELARVPKHILDLGSHDSVLAFVLDELEDPDTFLTSFRELYKHPERESQDVLRFTDGRVFERYSRPQRVEGETVGRVWSFRDVTARVRAEEALKVAADELERRVRERTQELEESEHRFRRLSEAAAEGIAVHEQGTLLLVNSALERMFGYAAGELIGRSILELAAPEERERAVQQVDETRKFLGLRKDGSTLPIEVTVKGSVHGGRGVRVATIRDTSAHELALAALRASEQRLRSISESAADAIVTADGAGNVSGWNQGASAIFGYEESEILGRPLTDLMPERYRAAHVDGMRRFASTGEPRVIGTTLELEALRKSGAEFPCDLSVSTWMAEGGPQFTAIMRDVSERNRVQAHLVLTDRMASVGTLAAGVAHEINNPLSYVMSNIDLALQGLGELGDPANGPLRALTELLDEARQGAERVRAIVRDLKTFSRADDAHSAAVDFRRVIDSSINMVWSEVRHRARLVKDYGPIPTVEGNESKLGQVVLNLLINAAQSIPEGAADRNEIRIATSTDLEGRAVLEVRDTGSGIPEDARRRLFDPFFTTKPVGEGTGLGLSICHGIVTAMGGTISVISAVGSGTTFRVVMPCSKTAQPIALAVAATKPGETGKTGRLLLIDDEPLVLRSLQRALGAAHELVALSSAREALAVIDGGERFDLVLCDLMMPEMSGMEFHDRLSATHPDLADKIIFVTGGAFTPAGRAFLAQLKNPCIDKPYDLRALRQLVRERLRAGE